MILYNVTINIDHDVHDEWLGWMKTKHIPAVLNTGLFIENRICRILDVEEGGKAYSIQYLLKNIDDYDTYQKEFAPSLQLEHTQKYQGEFAAFRTILEVVHEQKY